MICIDKSFIHLVISHKKNKKARKETVKQKIDPFFQVDISIVADNESMNAESIMADLSHIEKVDSNFSLENDKTFQNVESNFSSILEIKLFDFHLSFWKDTINIKWENLLELFEGVGLDCQKEIILRNQKLSNFQRIILFEYIQSELKIDNSKMQFNISIEDIRRFKQNKMNMYLDLNENKKYKYFFSHFPQFIPSLDDIEKNEKIITYENVFDTKCDEYYITPQSDYPKKESNLVKYALKDQKDNILFFDSLLIQQEKYNVCIETYFIMKVKYLKINLYSLLPAISGNVFNLTTKNIHHIQKIETLCKKNSKTLIKNQLRSIITISKSKFGNKLILNIDPIHNLAKIKKMKIFETTIQSLYYEYYFIEMIIFNHRIAKKLWKKDFASFVIKIREAGFCICSFVRFQVPQRIIEAPFSSFQILLEINIWA